ncbi:MAG: DUF2849 domain-containing protein [Parvibaculaceae bacterium]
MAQHTNKRATTQAVTANRLIDGEVVYFTAEGTWSDWLKDAAVADGKDACAALLAKAEPSVDAREVVEPYLFEVSEEADGIVPASVREKIRMAGPTIRPDLGKQAAAKQTVSA